MALLPRAALAVALCLAFVPSASASTAPVIRLAGTGEPAIYQDGGLPALETGMSYVEGVSTGVSGFGLVFTDPVDNRVLALAGDQVFVLAGNGDSGAGSDGTGRLTAVVPHPEAISACCQFPLINSYISDYSSSGGYGSHIRTLDTEGAPFPDGFVASAGSNIPKDF